jgi:hypothetical protein
MRFVERRDMAPNNLARQYRTLPSPETVICWQPDPQKNTKMRHIDAILMDTNRITVTLRRIIEYTSIM